jgi:excisionase family DNA binding protein
MATQKIMTISEVAELLKVHPITVYRLIKQGKLPYFRIGRVLRFDAGQLENWLLVKQRHLEARNARRKHKAASSADYVAYRRCETFGPERTLETLAIIRPLLVRAFVDAKQTGRTRLVCERCREDGEPIAALLLFASVERAKRPWKKTAMPFCRACFAKLRKLASNGPSAEASGRRALNAASKTHRKQTRPAGTRGRGKVAAVSPPS